MCGQIDHSNKIIRTHTKSMTLTIIAFPGQDNSVRHECHTWTTLSLIRMPPIFLPSRAWYNIISAGIGKSVSSISSKWTRAHGGHGFVKDKIACRFWINFCRISSIVSWGICYVVTKVYSFNQKLVKSLYSCMQHLHNTLDRAGSSPSARPRLLTAATSTTGHS